MQNKCSIFQVVVAWAVQMGGNASIKFGLCTVHKGVRRLKYEPHADIRIVRCTNCNGCKECKQLVPLVIPQGTGGSGCSAEVAAQAEALLVAALSKPGTAGAQQVGGTGAGGSNDGGRGTSDPSSSGSAATAPANSALVECAVCHRKPGDPGVPATLKLCSGCKVTRYCSAECQRKDWKMGHKAVCQALTKSKPPEVRNRQA
jgi:hypothetical protein